MVTGVPERRGLVGREVQLVHGSGTVHDLRAVRQVSQLDAVVVAIVGARVLHDGEAGNGLLGAAGAAVGALLVTDAGIALNTVPDDGRLVDNPLEVVLGGNGHAQGALVACDVSCHEPVLTGTEGKRAVLTHLDGRAVVRDGGHRVVGVRHLEGGAYAEPGSVRDASSLLERDGRSPGIHGEAGRAHVDGVAAHVRDLEVDDVAAVGGNLDLAVARSPIVATSELGAGELGRRVNVLGACDATAVMRLERHHSG